MKKIVGSVYQLIGAWSLVLVGSILLFLGFFSDPTGEIHPSVLTAFGEILTFAGAILGIDYRYRFGKKKDE